MDKALKTRLRTFAALKKNWDSYGAEPITPIAIEATAQLLERIYVFPTVIGGILVEFGNPEVFSFEVSAEGELVELSEAE
jgi:hypothetical protein